MIGKVKLLAAALVVACCYALAGCGGSTSGSSGGTSGGSSGGSTSNQRTSTSSGAEKQHLGVGNDKADHVPLDDPGAIMDQLGGDADIIRNSSSNKIDSDICPRILDEYLSNVKQLDVLNHGDTHATDMQLTAKNLVRNPGNCISLGGGHKG